MLRELPPVTSQQEGSIVHGAKRPRGAKPCIVRYVSVDAESLCAVGRVPHILPFL